MFLFFFNMVKVACQNKPRAAKARITVLEECFLCLLHKCIFFLCPYSLFHYKWERIKKSRTNKQNPRNKKKPKNPPQSKLDYVLVFNFLFLPGE